MKQGRKPIERFCRICGISLGFGTTRKYCMECLKKVQAGTVVQLRHKRGSAYEKWLKGKLEAEKESIQKYERELEQIKLSKMPKLWQFTNNNFPRPLTGTPLIPINIQKGEKQHESTG